MQVAVIGGGYTGLACATQLIRRGIDVVLYEKSDRLGGLAAGFREITWSSSLEEFYHHWFKTDECLFRFAKIWEAEDHLVFNRPSTVFQTDSHGFVPLDSAFALLKYPELSMPEKVRMGLSLAYLKLTRNWKKLEATTAEEWCQKFMGERGFQQIWQPLLVGKFGEKYAADVNMAWLWARLHCRTPELGTCRGGFDVFTRSAESFLNKSGARIFKEAQNIKLERTRVGWSVAALNHGIQEHDAVVVAASPRVFAGLAGQFAAEHVRETLGQPALGVQVVVLACSEQVGEHYWYSLKRNATQPFLAAVEHTNFVDSQEYGGEHLLYFAKYVDIQSEEWKQTDEHLVELALLGCRLINRKFNPETLIRSRVFRSEYAQPIVGKNASRFVPSVHVHGVPRLFHASLAHVYPWDRGTNFALELGERVGNEVVKSLGKKI